MLVRRAPRVPMIGIADPGRAETELAAGSLACPGCARPLQRWGHARTRTVRHHGHATLALRDLLQGAGQMIMPGCHVSRTSRL